MTRIAVIAVSLRNNMVFPFQGMSGETLTFGPRIQRRHHAVPNRIGLCPDPSPALRRGVQVDIAHQILRHTTPLTKPVLNVHPEMASALQPRDCRLERGEGTRRLAVLDVL